MDAKMVHLSTAQDVLRAANRRIAELEGVLKYALEHLGPPRGHVGCSCTACIEWNEFKHRAALRGE
jgi:hypothetical protein